MIVFYILLTVTVGLILFFSVEFIIKLRISTAKELPDESEKGYYSGIVNGKSFEDLYMFLSGQNDKIFFTEDEIFSCLKIQSDYINNRYDCSDFKTQLLFRIYKDCSENLNNECRELIKNTFLSFKYFMDEPGNDSMCYWSENHLILFAVSEYLAGQTWKKEIFSNSGLTGEQHRQKAQIRIEAWMEQRFLYGFSEYLSNNYLAEDIAPMANFISYCKDEALVTKMKIIMDILWFDVALNSTAGRFVAVSSRMYGNNKVGNYLGNSIKTAINVLWGKEALQNELIKPELSENEKLLIKENLSVRPNYIVLCFNETVRKGLYILPDVIKNIALTEECFISRMGCSLSPDDLENEELVGHEPHKIMAQFGAETFTNHQVINNTVSYLKINKMFSNSFLSYFRFLTLSWVKLIDMRKFSQKHNILPHGIATGRGNVYTYRTPRYTLSTDIRKNVDMCGAQGHEWTANLGENLTLFTTHPAGDGKSRFTASPGYWIGDGRRPMSVQHKSVNITVYRIPNKKRLGESSISDITHAYMPKCFYDEFIQDKDRIYARKNGIFIAFISNGELFYKPHDSDSLKGIYKNKVPKEEFSVTGEFDLCRKDGKYHSYITEISDIDRESFREFIDRINSNELNFSDDGYVSYTTLSETIFCSYNGEFRINGEKQQCVYKRYENKFCEAERKAEEIYISDKSHSLKLNYCKTERESKLL